MYLYIADSITNNKKAGLLALLQAFFFPSHAKSAVDYSKELSVHSNGIAPDSNRIPYYPGQNSGHLFVSNFHDFK